MCLDRKGGVKWVSLCLCFSFISGYCVYQAAVFRRNGQSLGYYGCVCVFVCVSHSPPPWPLSMTVLYMCVCVCECVRERESVCFFVFVCVCGGGGGVLLHHSSSQCERGGVCGRVFFC